MRFRLEAITKSEVGGSKERLETTIKSEQEGGMKTELSSAIREEQRARLEAAKSK